MPKGVYHREARTPDEVKSSLRSRLESMTEQVTESGCMIFMGYIDSLGYGIIAQNKRKRIKAHRASYSVFKADIPDGQSVMHRCDVRCCVNHDHLQIGTHHENMADMVKKARSRNRHTGRLAQ